jgi:uncharacterized protein YodC (DUF2158 family)
VSRGPQSIDIETRVQEEWSEQLSGIGLCEWFLIIDHGERGRESKEAVTKIAEHDSEKERERNNCVKTGVDFFISCHTVTVDERLECFGELVGTVECRWFASGTKLV